MTDVIDAIPRSTTVARQGIKDTQDVLNLEEAIIQDLADEILTPQRANAMNNAVAKMLKAAEMSVRLGVKVNGRKAFPLATGDRPSSEKSGAG